MGLRKGKFLFSLYKNDPKTMSEVLYRADFPFGETSPRMVTVFLDG